MEGAEVEDCGTGLGKDVKDGDVAAGGRKGFSEGEPKASSGAAKHDRLTFEGELGAEVGLVFAQNGKGYLRDPLVPELEMILCYSERVIARLNNAATVN